MKKSQTHIVYLNGNKMNSKRGFSEELKTSMNFPSYFRNNLDAVWDCMTDLAWLDANNVELKIHSWKGSKKNLKFDYFSFLSKVQSHWNNQTKQEILISINYE